ncbi:RTA1 like protein-domain-containing protein [Lipomyces chichibuensis]|uniref:RTA1 like protein-domain-containing protein n=1 Tax=Lipomyces chichibuensis TaxID=1546026 RepID=UPI003343A2BB
MVHSYYDYTPSQTAAAVFAALFSAAFSATFIQWIRYRAWVWLVMVVAASMESLGYIFRSISTRHTDNRGVFIAQFSLIILAPVLIAASCYVIFGRIVFHVIPAHSRTMKFLWVPPRFITLIFVFCDIVALFLQLVGAVIVSGTQPTDPDAKSKLSRGKDIAIAGLAVQLLCFGLFSIVAIRFNFISKQFNKEFEDKIGSVKGEKYFTVASSNRKLKKNWKALLRVVNIVCVLILIRSVYRVCDFALGKNGYLEQNEWPAYVFDAAPMLPCVMLFVYWHPGRYLPYLGFRLPKSAREN